jgi:hypothetical protein
MGVHNPNRMALLLGLQGLSQGVQLLKCDMADLVVEITRAGRIKAFQGQDQAVADQAPSEMSVGTPLKPRIALKGDFQQLGIDRLRNPEDRRRPRVGYERFDSHWISSLT